MLKRDRVALTELVTSFSASTQAAETGIERLQAATEGPGRQIQKLLESGTTLKEDLTFLVQRGEGLADRLDDCVRAARSAPAVSESPAARSPYAAQMEPVEAPRRRMNVEPAESLRRRTNVEPALREPGLREPGPRETEPKVRSQAERDLLKALRMVR